MKKFITSLALVFVMLGVGLFVGCGDNEFAGADTVDAKAVTDYVQTVDTNFEGYSVKLKLNNKLCLN